MKTNTKALIQSTANYLVRLFTILTVVLFAGCEDFFLSESTGVEVPFSKPKITVFSHISPQTETIKVWVNRTHPQSNSQSNYVPVNGNATVKMAIKGAPPVELTYNAEKRYFSIAASDFPILPNSFYLLEITTPLGERVTAQCFVPAFDIGEVSYSPIKLSDWYNNKKTGNIVWTVTPKDSQLGAFFSVGAFSRYWPSPTSQNPVSAFVLERAYNIETGTMFVKNTSGLPFTSRAVYYSETGIYDHNTNQIYTYPIDSVFVYVMVTDENYYLFTKACKVGIMQMTIFLRHQLLFFRILLGASELLPDTIDAITMFPLINAIFVIRKKFFQTICK